jgi:perosamine synthetase
MSDFLPFALPDITDTEKRAVLDTLGSSWITTGPRTKDFEARFAAAVGAKHAIALNSCTAALHLALEAVGVKAGDEVIVPTLTFAASAEVIRYLDAKPVLVDVLPGDHTMDPVAVEGAITPRTRAIMPVHFGGQACDMEPILEIARARKIPVIEDAAHAFPTYYKGKIVGSIGDITCFSFYATKTITTGEGGMAVTDNGEWAERMRIMSLHGISKDAWKRYTAEGNWYYEIIAPGYKYNMTDIAAALGLVQLSRAQEMLEKRRAIARSYTEAFKDHPAIELLDVRDFDSHAWHLYVIKLRDGVLSIDRNRFIEELKQKGIGTSVHFIPLHIHPYYRDTYGYQPGDFPVALDCYRRSISLPIYSKMSMADVNRVIDAVVEICNKHKM